jgi:hypothetical protein
VNGDGRADVVVAADGADRGQRRDGGAVYVVFGSSSTQTVDLAALDARGFSVDGAGAGDNAGLAIAVRPAAADGRLDLVIGAPRSDNGMRLDSGSAYVAALDGRPPVLGLGGPSPQQIVARKGVVVQARCGEACELSARGVIVLPGARGDLRLARATGRLSGAGVRSLRLGLSGKQLRRLRETLEPGRRARATVTVRAVDPAGNATVAMRSIVVRR